MTNIVSDKSNCVFAASKAICASILMLLKSQFLMSLTIIPEYVVFVI